MPSTEQSKTCQNACSQCSGSDTLQLDSSDPAATYNSIKIPQISVSRSDGILKGFVEKFQLNASSNMAYIEIPLSVTQNRTGFIPAMSLSYIFEAGTARMA